LLDRIGIPSATIEILKKQLKVKGFTSHGICYYRKGGRNTGDPHTSSGNSWMNALITIIALCRMDPNIVLDLTNPPFSLAIQGDDSLIIVNNAWKESHWDEDIWLNTWIDFGFKVKFVKISTKVSDCDYCSKYFWPTDGHPVGYLLGPKPGKTLAKLGWSTRAHQNLMKHNRGVALGLLPAVGHVPFLKEFVNRVLEITNVDSCKDVTADVRKYKVETSKAFDYCDRTWPFLAELYDCDKVDVDLFQHTLDQMITFPYHFTSEIVGRMEHVDNY
jgi:hypothetical protein